MQSACFFNGCCKGICTSSRAHRMDFKNHFGVALLLVLLAVTARGSPQHAGRGSSDGSPTVTIGNKSTSLQLGAANAGFPMASLSYKQNTIWSDHSAPMWSARVLTKSDPITFTSSAGASLLHSDETSAKLQWEVENGGCALQVQVTVSLQRPNDDDGLFELSPSVSVTSGQCSLDSMTFSFPTTPHLSDSLFWPYSFGQVFDNPHTLDNKDSGLYPSAQISMQWASYYWKDASADTGFYTGAHDRTGGIKSLSWSKASDGVYSLAWTVFPEDRGTSSSPTWTMSFPVVFGCYDGDWFEGSQIYRDWMKDNAVWKERKTPLPQWLKENHLWFNTGWQPKDIFNVTQGDPDLVVDEMREIRKTFPNSTIALHWYVFSEDIVFDQGYPEYFPVKPGFAQAVAYLQDTLKVNVAPYINGRIFDIKTEMWEKDSATDSACKLASSVVDDDDFTNYQEEYGSGAVFNVMCPHTSYWQGVIADTVATLTLNYTCNGVYIDQIGAADPRPCYNTSHGHSRGGGSFWVDGYRRMILEAKQLSRPEIGLVTEDNSESFIDTIDGLLSLTAFSPDYSGPNRMVPAFPAIYGGQFAAFGQVFTRSDLLVNPTVFAAKVGQMFVYGSQVGWISLAGSNDDPPMGMFDLLTDGAYASEVQYMNDVLALRAEVQEYLAGGRLMKNVQVQAKNEAFKSLAATYAGKQNDLKFEEKQFNPLMSAVWASQEGQERSFVVLLTNVGHSVSGEFILSKSDYCMDGTQPQPLGGVNFALLDVGETMKVPFTLGKYASHSWQFSCAPSVFSTVA